MTQTGAPPVFHWSPLGQVSTVKEIADAVVYLTEAQTITGEVLHVDGGHQIAGMM